MRGMCLIVLVLAAGCATSQQGEDTAELYWDGAGLEYDVTRPPAPLQGSVQADVTLLEMDVPAADKLFGMGGSDDISPKSFREPMGEIAAVNACYGHGRVIGRTTVWITLGGEVRLEYIWDNIYLRDWEGRPEAPTPLFDVYSEGVEGKLKLFEVKGGVNIVVDAVSSHGGWPILDIETSTGVANRVKIQLPELSITQRVGTETVALNETAMFQLSRARYGEGNRIRLLFVRLRGAED
jgi:hypothetical protein